MNDLSGRIAVITGANTGIGRVTALELARRGAEVTLACRSRAKAEPVIEAIKETTGNAAVDLVLLDLASLDSVRAAADELLSRDRPLHLLINNAGLAGQRGLTKDGFELAFGVNHLGHFLLTKLLLDKLSASGPSRIVNVASRAHYDARGIDWELLRKPTQSVTGVPEYAVSKLANVLFSSELARQLADRNVASYSLHPGVVASDVWRRIPWPIRSLMKLFMISNEEGAETTLHCATSDQIADDSGRYFDESKPKEPSALAQDTELAEELWKRSDAWVT